MIYPLGILNSKTESGNLTFQTRPSLGSFDSNSEDSSMKIHANQMEELKNEISNSILVRSEQSAGLIVHATDVK